NVRLHWVDASRVHAHEHFRRARFWRWRLVDAHHIGTAELADENSSHGAKCYHDGLTFGPMGQVVRLHKTVGVKVGRVQVGGGARIVVESMTMTDTADAARTAAQCIELAEAGSEMVRVTVNVAEAAIAVPEIKQRMLDAGCTAPLIGDFHY